MSLESPGDFLGPTHQTRQVAPETGPTPAVELVADYRGGSVKPTVRVDWDLLERGDVSVRLAVQDSAGKTVNIPFTMANSVREVISRISDGYIAANEATNLDLDASKVSTWANPMEKQVGSPIKMVNDLVRWQQFLDTVGSLKPAASHDRRWEALRPKLLDWVDNLYGQCLAVLRSRLRNQAEGAGTIRELLTSRNAVLLDIALRIVALEPAIEAAVQHKLVELYADVAVDDSIRIRAYNGLLDSARTYADELVSGEVE